MEDGEGDIPGGGEGDLLSFEISSAIGNTGYGKQGAGYVSFAMWAHHAVYFDDNGIHI